MKKKIIVLSTGLACLFLMFSCADSGTPQESTETVQQDLPVPPSHAEMVARGEYLVNASVCADCHAPKIMTEKGPVPDMDRFLSGHPADSKLPPPAPDAVKNGWVLFSPDLTTAIGPWGTSFSANLTPDTATGIGAWTEENFLNAFKGGKFHGLPAGRTLLPPMPWEFFKNMTDEDALSIFAFLKTLKPVSNAVPPPIPPAGS